MIRGCCAPVAVKDPPQLGHAVKLADVALLLLLIVMLDDIFRVSD